MCCCLSLRLVKVLNNISQRTTFDFKGQIIAISGIRESLTKFAQLYDIIQLKQFEISYGIGVLKNTQPMAYPLNLWRLHI